MSYSIPRNFSERMIDPWSSNTSIKSLVLATQSTDEVSTARAASPTWTATRLHVPETKYQPVVAIDAPELSLSTRPGASLGQMILRIETDRDRLNASDEVTLRIDTSDLPPGVQLSRSTIADAGAVEEVVVYLPDGTDAAFDLSVEAETADSATRKIGDAQASIDVHVAYHDNRTKLTFEAHDQDIWGRGDAFEFTDQRFIGFENDFRWSDGDGFIEGRASGGIKLGFDSDLAIEGGALDAEMPFLIDYDTFYDYATDTLTIDPGASATRGGSFETDGPSVKYALDFVFDAFFDADIRFEHWGANFDILDTDRSWSTTRNLINLDSERGDTWKNNLGFGVSLDLALPEIDVSGRDSWFGGNLSGRDRSNDIVELGIDIDQMVTEALGLPVNLLDWRSGVVDLGIVELEAYYTLLHAAVNGGIGLEQGFTVTPGKITGDLVFENGSRRAVDLGAWNNEVVLDDASSFDADGDGAIEFAFELEHDGARVTNDTDLVADLGFDVKFLEAGARYDAPGDGEDDLDDRVSVGPLWKTGGSTEIGSIDVYNETFQIAFEGETLYFTA